MATGSALLTNLWSIIRYHRRPLMGFHLYFSALVLFLFAPVVTGLLEIMVRFSGASLISNDELVRFLFTPLGNLWLVISGILLSLLLFLQVAGIVILTTRNTKGVYPSSANALWAVLIRLPRLLKLAGLQVLLHGLVLLPILFAVRASFVYFLGEYDIYFVINNRPPELIGFTVSLLIALSLIVLVNGQLYARYCLSLPLLIIEGRGPIDALKRSAVLVRQTRLKVVRLSLFVAGSVALPVLVFNLLMQGVGGLLFAILPNVVTLQIVLTLLLIISSAIMGVVLSFVAISSNSLVLLKLYRRAVGHEPICFNEEEPRSTVVFAWSFEILLVLFAIVQISDLAARVTPAEEALVIAHRGASWQAPENSLSAIELAIQQGADYIELDVQRTADGVLVLKHDRDLLRVAGDPRRIWDIDYADLQQLDAGTWFAPEFAGEVVPSLASAIELVDGRAGLYLEIKNASFMPGIVEQTVALVQQMGVVDSTVIAALSPSVLNQVQRLEPALRTSLLVHSSIGRLPYDRYDILALRGATITPQVRRLASQHNTELHAWTINNDYLVHRYLDVGVDGIITDVPDLVREVLVQRQDLNRAELFLLRLRDWIWH